MSTLKKIGYLDLLLSMTSSDIPSGEVRHNNSEWETVMKSDFAKVPSDNDTRKIR